MSKLPGGFRAEWSVWCALVSTPKAADDCPMWTAIEGKRFKERARDAKSQGWRYFNGIGWVCPQCQEKMKHA